MNEPKSEPRSNSTGSTPSSRTWFVGVGLALLVATCAGLWYAWQSGIIPGNAVAPIAENFQRAISAWTQAESSQRGALCVTPVMTRVNPPRGYTALPFDATPSGFSITLRNEPTSNTEMQSLQQMDLLTRAGILAAKNVTLSEGADPVPARKFSMTWEGFATTRGNGCFIYGRRDTVDVVSFERKNNDAGLVAYEVTYRNRVGKPAPWASTPEFRQIFPEAASGLDGTLQKITLIRGQHDWFAAGAIEKAARTDTYRADREKRLQLAGPLSKDILKARLVQSGQDLQEACIPLRGQMVSVRTGRPGGVSDRPPEPYTETFVNIDRNESERLQVLRNYVLMRKLEAAGLFTSEIAPVFEHQGRPARGAVRFTAVPEAMNALSPSHSCLLLGRTEMDVLSFDADSVPLGSGVPFVGRAQIVTPTEWGKKAAQHIPELADLYSQGIPFTGTASVSNDAWNVSIQLRIPPLVLDTTEVSLPDIEPPKGAGRTVTSATNFAGGKKTDVAVAGDVVFVTGLGGKVSNGGLTATYCCAGARSVVVASRILNGGRNYVEATVKAAPGRISPNTWTNIGLADAVGTNMPSSDGMWLLGHNEISTVRSGATFGLAIDMDERLLYWHTDGSWRTGLPGSGAGIRLPRGTPKVFGVTISAPGAAGLDTWTVNFGKTQFKYPLPRGYRSYDGRRVAR